MIVSLSTNDPPLVTRYRREMPDANLGQMLDALAGRVTLLSPPVALGVPVSRLRLLIVHS